MKRTDGRKLVMSRDGIEMSMEIFKTNDQSLNPYMKKIINDYETIFKIVEGHRAQGHRIVATIGSWDGVHEGQFRYLLKASQLGDFLVVGVDSDRSIKLYKTADWRPVRNQERRSELVAYPEYVDVVTLVDDVDDAGIWQLGLLKLIRPDTYVAVTDSYPKGQLEEIAKICGELVVLEPQSIGISSTKEVEEVLLKRLDKGYRLMVEDIKAGKI